MKALRYLYFDIGGLSVFRPYKSLFVYGIKSVGHGNTTSYRKGCRCDECKAANTASYMKWKRSRSPKHIPHHVHGTLGGYTNYYCRCDRCKTAKSAEDRSYQKRKKDEMNNGLVQSKEESSCTKSEQRCEQIAELLEEALEVTQEFHKVVDKQSAFLKKAIRRTGRDA
jgi:hypothetical protein